MKIVITGGAGFIGKHLANHLCDEGDEVIVIDNLKSGTKSGLKKGIKFIEADVCNIMNTLQGHCAHTVYHLAAQPRIQPSFVDEGYTLRNNLIGTVQALEYAKCVGANLIYAGSSSCYGGILNSPYAYSKFSGGQLCELYSKLYKVPTVITRFYNAYGPGQIEYGDYATVIGIFEKHHRGNQKLPVVAPGTQRRDFTHVDDIVNALVILKDRKYYGQIFELGRGENFSIFEIAQMFEDSIEMIGTRSGEYPQTLANYEEAHKKLNWKPTRNLKDYVKSILQNK